jgi:hypothetical protein
MTAQERLAPKREPFIDANGEVRESIVLTEATTITLEVLKDGRMVAQTFKLPAGKRILF